MALFSRIGFRRSASRLAGLIRTETEAGAARSPLGFEARPASPAGGIRYSSAVAVDAPSSTNLTYYFSLAGIAALGAGTAYTFYSSQPSSGIHLAKLPAHQLPHELPDFQLTDHKGKIFTHNNLKNEFAVLLFGTLDNPDTRMWLERLGKMICESDDKCNQEHLTPVFLCLDQEKDTPERIAQLGTSLKSRNLHKEVLHRRIEIVTGEDVTKIHEAAHTFTKKFFNKHPEGTGTPESTHLGDIYMISPEGKFLESYSLDDDAHAIAADWAEVQRAWNISRPSWHDRDAHHMNLRYSAIPERQRKRIDKA